MIIHAEICAVVKAWIEQALAHNDWCLILRWSHQLHVHCLFVRSCRHLHVQEAAVQLVLSESLLKLFRLVKHDASVIWEATLLLVWSLTNVMWGRAGRNASTRADCSIRVTSIPSLPTAMLVLSEYLRYVLASDWSDRRALHHNRGLLVLDDGILILIGQEIVKRAPNSLSIAKVKAIVAICSSWSGSSSAVFEWLCATLGTLLEVANSDGLASLHSVRCHYLTVLMMHLQVRAGRLKLAWRPWKVINAHVAFNSVSDKHNGSEMRTKKISWLTYYTAPSQHKWATWDLKSWSFCSWRPLVSIVKFWVASLADCQSCLHLALLRCSGRSSVSSLFCCCPIWEVHLMEHPY